MNTCIRDHLLDKNGKRLGTKVLHHINATVARHICSGGNLCKRTTGEEHPEAGKCTHIPRTGPRVSAIFGVHLSGRTACPGVEILTLSPSHVGSEQGLLTVSFTSHPPLEEAFMEGLPEPPDKGSYMTNNRNCCAPTDLVYAKGDGEALV